MSISTLAKSTSTDRSGSSQFQIRIIHERIRLNEEKEKKKKTQNLRQKIKSEKIDLHPEWFMFQLQCHSDHHKLV